MQKDGKHISWRHLEELYRRDGGAFRDASGLSLLHKIMFEHTKLMSYSKMHVDLAAQVSGVQMKIDKRSAFTLSTQTLHIVIDLKCEDGIWIVSYIGCHNFMVTGLKNITFDM